MPLIFYQSCKYHKLSTDSTVFNSGKQNSKSKLITSEFILGRLFDHVLGNKNRPRDLDVHFKPTQDMQNIFTK